MNNLLVWLFLITLSVVVQAADPAPPAGGQVAAPNAASKGEEDIADSSSDPFDEQAPLPSILGDFDTSGANLDLLIYKRSDFNDFHGKTIIIPFRYQGKD